MAVNACVKSIFRTQKTIVLTQKFVEQFPFALSPELVEGSKGDTLRRSCFAGSPSPCPSPPSGARGLNTPPLPRWERAGVRVSSGFMNNTG